jgi:hypothetical protein
MIRALRFGGTENPYSVAEKHFTKALNAWTEVGERQETAKGLGYLAAGLAKDIPEIKTQLKQLTSRLNVNG